MNHSVGLRGHGHWAPSVLLATPLPFVPTPTLAAAKTVCDALTRHLTFLRVSPSDAAEPIRTDPSSGHPTERSARVDEDGGDFFSVVGASAVSIDADLVVIPDMEGASGRAIHELALGSGIPVLLMRDSTRSGVIVAATDLRDPLFPVLRAAVLVASRLGARLVFFHNLNPSMPPAGGTDLRRGVRPSVLDRLDDLASAAFALRTESENVVTMRQGPSDALVSVVRSQRPDVVVIGARRRGSLHEREATLAATVIDATSSSVLVVPHHLPASTPYVCRS